MADEGRAASVDVDPGVNPAAGEVNAEEGSASRGVVRLRLAAGLARKIDGFMKHIPQA
jgi:hypothetical protein